MFNTRGSYSIIAGLQWQNNFRSRGNRMTSAEENMWDPFNIGVYAIEVGLIGAILYALVALPALLKPMN